MRFNVERLHAQIERQGILCTWYKSIRCPCIMQNEGHPIDGCALCEGYGYVWHDPVDISVLFHGFVINREYSEEGVSEPGIAQITVPAHKIVNGALNDIVIGQYDKFKIMDNGHIRKHSDIFKKGDTYLGGVSTEKLSSHDIISVQYCRDLNTIYAFGTSFTIIVDGNGDLRKVNWIAGKPQPATGSFYSIEYSARPEFVVVDLPAQSRAEGNIKLPYRITLQKLQEFKGQQKE